jgi:hypothetical protein
MSRRTLFAVVATASALLGCAAGYEVTLMTTSVSETPTAPKPANTLFPMISVSPTPSPKTAPASGTHVPISPQEAAQLHGTPGAGTAPMP